MTIAVAAAVIFAAITVGFMLRHRLPAAARSASGFTLQTLIVTAVLVLVAVGATAIFIALSRSNEENLAESDSDIEAREQQHGVIDPLGNLSYTWRCGLHEEYVLNTSGEAGTCQTRCYARFAKGGGLKWDRLIQRRIDGIQNDPDLDAAAKTAQQAPLRRLLLGASAWDDDGTSDNNKAIFTQSDFGQIVYSETDPGFGNFELRGNGTVIALDGTCILTQEICSFNEQRREALIRRWEDSIDRSLAGRAEAIPIPAGVLELRDHLKC